jgi:uncharacterized protein
MKRRAFLNFATVAAAATAFPAAPAFAATTTSAARRLDAWPRLVGAWQRDGTYYAGWWSQDRGPNGVEVPFRAHGVLIDPLDPAFAIAVARRPGEYIIRFHENNASDAVLASADAERVFEGHAAFSLDGAVIYTTESDTSNGNGVVGVRDAATLAKQREFTTHGIGPHALLMEPQGTLLVANGGVLTLPETGRAKLDTAHMDPSLVRIDARNGQMLAQWRLADPQLSIRHLERAPNGIVGVALQAEHPDARSRDEAPVLALFDGTSLKTAHASCGPSLGGYGGDIACVAAKDTIYFAVGCTHANTVALWDIEGHWQGSVPLQSACAMAPDGEALIAANDAGELARISIDTLVALTDRTPSLAWDNHVVVRKKLVSWR